MFIWLNLCLVVFWWFSRFLFLLLSSIPSGLLAGYLHISLVKCVSWMSLACVNESVVADMVSLSLLIYEVNIDSFFCVLGSYTKSCIEALVCYFSSAEQQSVSEFWSPGTNFQKYNEEIARETIRSPCLTSFLNHMSNPILPCHSSFFYLFMLWCIFSSHHLLSRSPWIIPFGQASLLLAILIWKVYPVIPFWPSVSSCAKECFKKNFFNTKFSKGSRICPDRVMI